jgi:hypothetical protein
MVEIPQGDELYALSIDFNHVQLLEMLKFAPDGTIKQVMGELEDDAFTPRTIDIQQSFFVDLTVSLGNIQRNQHEAFVPFVIKNINANENKSSETIVDNLYFSFDALQRAFNSVNLKIDIAWLLKQLKIIEDRKESVDECRFILNMLCVLHLKNVAVSVYEEEEPDLDNSIYEYYLDLINELEVDFKRFIIIAGEDFFKSNFYEYDGEGGENQVLAYLIYQNYDDVTRFLQSQYKDFQAMLKEVIKDEYFYESYLEAVESIETLEDYFDNVETVKLFEWANNGFMIYGRG